MSAPTDFHAIVTSTDDDPRVLLVAASQLPQAVVAAAMTSGAVWLKTRHGIRRLRRRSAKLSVGDEIFLNYDPAVLAQSCPPAELVQDGGRWSVWDKPGGMRSQGSRWGDHTTLSRHAETHLLPQRDAFIVHRLDLAARGLMLLAHDKKAAAHLSKQFADRTVEKRYRAIVRGNFPASDNPQTYTGEIDGKAAHTQVWQLQFDPSLNRTSLMVDIKTGRKHQIRRHLADAGFPIVGDRLYGSGDDEEDLCLYACLLAFDDPATNERVKIERQPADWL